MGFRIDVVVEHRDGDGNLVSRQTTKDQADLERLDELKALLEERLRQRVEADKKEKEKQREREMEDTKGG